MKAPVAVTLVLVLCACGKGAEIPAVTVSDSAGVRIVQYSATADAPAWHLDTTSAVAVGTDADTLKLFGVGAALQLVGGDIVVADGGNHRLLFFDTSGAFEHSVGRQGDGPGEFKDVTGVSDAWPDSLLVWDRMTRRISVFDDTGTFVRSFSLATTDSVPYPILTAVYADGSFAVGGTVRLPAGSVPTGRHAFQSSVYHYGRSGAYLGRTGSFSTGEVYFRAFQGGFGIAPVVFGTAAHELVSQNRFVFVSTDRYEVRFYRPDGSLVQIVRRPPLARPVTDAARKAEEDRLLQQVPEARRAEMRKTLESEEAPDVIPEINSVGRDGLGRIWVQPFMLGDAQAAQPWQVYAPDGTFVGRVVLPQGFRLTDAGDDFVLGVQKDELGVESVVRMRLTGS